MQKHIQGNLRGNFFKFLKKSLSASLIIAMFAMQSSYAAIVGDSNFNTNVNTSGNTTNISGGVIKDGTGFHHFSQFGLDNGQIANLLFGNASRFVNLVDGKISINGIFNAIKGYSSSGAIGGDVIFVSPLGMIVGASGVMNVGSLQTITPIQSSYDSVVGKGSAITWADVSGLKSDSTTSSTEIYGKIFARDSINIAESKDLTIGANAGIVSGFNDNGFAKTRTGDLSNIVNTQGVVDASYMEATSGGIKIVANNIESDGSSSFMHSSGDVALDATTTGIISLDSSIKANGAVNIGNVYSSNSTGDIYINNNIDAGGDVNIGALYTVNQGEGLSIKGSSVGINTSILSTEGNIYADNGIHLAAGNSITQGNNSEIINNTSGDIAINSATGNVVLNKITNKGGNVEIQSGDLTLNNTVESQTGDISITSRGDISQKDDTFDSLKSGGNLNITTAANVEIGSESQALRVNVGGDVDITNRTRASVYLKSVDSDLSINKITNGSDIKIDSNKKITVKQNIASNSSISLNSGEGFVQSSDSTITNTGTGGLTITNSSSGNVELNTITAGNNNLNITNNAQDGDIVLNNNISSNNNIVLNSQGGITQGTKSETISAGGNLELNAVSDIGSDEQHILFSNGGTFSANTSGGVHLTAENSDISLGSIAAGTDYDIKATGDGVVIFDRDLTDIKGDLKIETNSALNIENAIKAEGDIVLKTNNGDILLNALITSVNESIILDAQGGIYQDSSFDSTALNAAKNIELLALTGDVGSADSSIQLVSKGLVNVDGGNVYLQSPESINIAGINFGKENPNTVVNIKTTTASDGNVTFSGLVKGSDITIDSAQGIFQTSANDKTIESTGALNLKTANGDIGETGKAIKFSSSSVSADSSGSVVLTGVDTDIRTSQIKSHGNIDLSTEVRSVLTDAGRIIVEGDLTTTNGYITLSSARTLDLDNNISASTNINLLATGGINQKAGTTITSGTGGVATSGDIAITNFSSGDISLNSVTANNGNIVISNESSGSNVILNSLINSTDGSVTVSSSGNIRQTFQDGASVAAAKDVTLNAGNAGSVDNYMIVNAGESLNAKVNNIYAKNSTGDLVLGEINAVQNVYLSSEGNILQSDYSKDSIKAGRSINLSSSKNIGQDVNNGLAVSGSAIVTAAGENVHLASYGNLNTGVIEAQNDVSVTGKSSSGINIKDNITANGNITLSSQGAIAQEAGTIHKNGTQSGNISITSDGGNINLKDVVNDNGAINIAGNSLTHGIYLESLIKATGGDITINTNGPLKQTAQGVSLYTDRALVINSNNYNIGESGNSITFTALDGVSANAGSGSIYLSAIDSNIDTANIVSGQDIDLAVKGGELLVSGELITNNGYISLVTDRAINIEHKISASKYINIDAQGAITQDAALDLALETINGDITLNANGHDIGAGGNSLSVNAGGSFNADGTNIYVKSPNKDLNLNNINSTGKVDIATVNSGNINLGSIVNGTDITLSAADGIYQSTAGKKINASGALNLVAEKESIGQKGNAINFSAGSVSADAEKSVVLLGEDTDINTSSIKANENIDLSTVVTDSSSDKGKITVANDLTTTNGYIRLDSAKALDINKNITAGQSITLNANGGIVQSSGTSVTAGTAAAVTDGSITVTNKGSGGITLTDVSTGSGDINISNIENADGEITLGRVNASSGDISVLNDAQNRNIVLNNLVSTNSGSITLDSKGAIIQDSSYSGVVLNSGNDLTLNAVNDLGSASNKIKINAQNSLNASGSNIYLDSPSKTLNIAGITSGGIVDVSTSSDGDININGRITGSDVTLEAYKNINQSIEGQSISATGALVLKSLNGDIGSTGSPVIFKAATIAAEALSGSIVLAGIETDIFTDSIKSGHNLDLSTLNSGSITISNAIDVNGYMRLNSAEGLNVSSNLTAGDYLELGAVNDILLGAVVTSTGGNITVSSTEGSVLQNSTSALLSAANDVTVNAAQNAGAENNQILIKAGGTLNGSAGNFYVKNSEGALTIGSVNSNNNVKISSTGDIVQSNQDSASITAGGNVYLESTGDIGKSESNSLIVDALGTVNSDSSNIWLSSSNDINTGVINAVNTVNVKTTGSDKNIILKDKITAGDVVLTSSGNIKQDSSLNKTIDANNLTLVAQNGSIGETGNAIDFSASGNLDATAAGAVILNGVGRDIDTSNISAGTSIDLSTEESGKIIVSNDLTANNGYIRLNAVDGVELNDSNLTALEYVTLISQTGDILLNSIINAGTDITLDAHGAISQNISGSALNAGGDINLLATGSIGSSDNKITLSADGDVAANGAEVYLTSHNKDLNLGNIYTTGGNGTVDLSTTGAGNININGEITGSNVSLDAYNGIYQSSDEKTITAKGALSLNAQNNDIGTTDKAIKFEADSVTAHAPNGSVVLNGVNTDINTNSVTAGQNIDLSTTGSGNINVADALSANGYIRLDSAENLTINRDLTSSSYIYLGAQKGLNLASTIQAASDVTVNATGNIIQSSGSVVSTGGDVLVTGRGGVIDLNNITAFNNVNISAEGDSSVAMTLGGITASNGNITASNSTGGNILIDSVLTASNGDISVNTAGGNVSQTGSGQSLLAGKDIFLSGNSVGSSSQYMNISAGGNVSADGVDIYLENNDGEFRIGNINSNSSITNNTVNLKSNNGDIKFNGLVKGDNVTVDSAGGVKQEASLSKSVEANTVTFTANNGSVGESGNAIDMSVSGAVNVNKADNVYLNGVNSSSSLNTGNINADNEVVLTSAGGLRLNGVINALSASLTAQTNITQNSGLENGLSIIADTVNLVSNSGSIGETGNAIGFKASDISASASKGSVILNGIESNINTNTIVAGKDIDLSTTTSGDITISNALTATGYIRLNAAESLSVNNNLTANSTITLIAQDGSVLLDNSVVNGSSVSVSATQGITQNGGSITSGSGAVSIVNNGTDDSGIKLSTIKSSRSLVVRNNAHGKVQLTNNVQGSDVNISSHGGIEQTSGTITGITSQGVTLTNSDSGDISILNVKANSGAINISNTNAGKIKTGNLDANTTISVTNGAGSTGTVELGSLTTKSTSTGYGNITVSNLSDNGVILNADVSGTDININSNGGIEQKSGNITATRGAVITNNNNGGIKLNNVTTANTMTITNAGNGDITVNDLSSRSRIAITNNSSSAHDISLRAVRNTSANGISVINQSGGNILMNGLIQSTAGSNIVIDATTGAVSQTINTLALSTTGSVTLGGEKGIGSGSSYIRVNSQDVTLKGKDIYLTSPNKDLVIASFSNPTGGGVVDLRTTGSGNISINADIAADDVLLNAVDSITAAGDILAQNAITATAKSITQSADSSFAAQDGSVEIMANAGNIALNGSVTSSGSDVIISNDSTGANSVTVNNVSAGGSYTITNKGNGLVTVNGNLNNGENSYITAGSGTNSGIVISDSAVLNNKNGSLEIENFGQKGISLGGTINNNIADGTTVKVSNTAGGLVVNADINNGASEGAANSIILNNSGSEGLNIASGTINNYGTLTVENSNGDMSLNGALNAQLGSTNEFVNSADSDFVIGMKLASYGNTITFENRKNGSLIVDDDAEISVYSTQKDGNVYTGVLNLINSSNDGTEGGGITVNGTINNGNASTAGGIVNITNSGNGQANDYGITLGEASVINNYSELNIENLDNNGKAAGNIVINGSVSGDRGPVVTGSSSAPVPSGSVITIKNDVTNSNSGVVFGSTANVAAKGNKINIINDGQKGITFENGSNLSNTDTITVTNNKGSFNLDKGAAVSSTGSVVVSNNEAGNSVNIKGSLKGGNVEIGSNASNVNIDGTVSGSNITINASDANVNIAHNSQNANLQADKDITVKVSNGSILNHSDTETSISGGKGLAAGGNINLEADNIGTADSSVDNILDNGFNLDSTKSINISAGGTVNAAAQNTLNLSALSGNLNLGTVNASEAILSAVNGSISGEDVSSVNNMYLYTKADTGAVNIKNVSTGGKLFAESGSDMTIHSDNGLDIETMLSRKGSINLTADGNTEIREIAAQKDINITVNDEKLTIVDLGRVKRNQDIIPRNINITVNDAKNPDKTTANGKLDIYNGYARDKVTLKADTITAQAYDISDGAVKGQKRLDKYGNEATGFHNANQNGKLLEFDIQGANYEQPDAGSEPHNGYYKPDASDKHALDVYITLGDSVGDAEYGANFKKLYADRAFVDSINVAEPDAYSRIIVESGIIGEKAIFRNNKLRLDIDNTDVVRDYPINIHYDDEPDKTVTNKTSFNFEMYDEIEMDRKYNPDAPVTPVLPENPDEYNPNRIVNTPDYNKDISGVTRNDKNVTKTVESKDTDNSITAHDQSTGLKNISWVVRNKDNQVLGASAPVARPAFDKLISISQKGIKVSQDKQNTQIQVKKGEILHIDMKYKDVAFNTDGKVSKISKDIVEIKFLNPDKITKTVIRFLNMYNENL